MSPIPVIDLFAGPGGLGEGFAAFEEEGRRFRLALSIEKDEIAHRTLELRAFFRQFDRADVPEDYYRHLRNREEVTRRQLFERHPQAAAAAQQQAWHAELGRVSSAEVDRRIRAALAGAPDWVLIGGPPCQAYSIKGMAPWLSEPIGPVTSCSLHCAFTWGLNSAAFMDAIRRSFRSHVRLSEPPTPSQ